MRRLFLSLVLFTALFAPWPGGGGRASAEQIQRIAAIVNDDVISMYDLVSRLRLIIVSSRLPDTPETRRRLAPQILRNLIDERLKLQEAARLNIKVSKREMQRAIAVLEKRNNLEPGDFGAFLAKARLPKHAVLAQLRAAFAWNKVVAQRIRPRVRVSPEEVDEVLKRIRNNQSSLQYDVSEIFLSVDSPEQEASVRATATRLVEQIRAGGDFAAIARQFSQGGTAAEGGRIGWVQRGQLKGALDKALATMKPGELSKPIRSLTGFHILYLRQRRTTAAKPRDDLSVSLRQVVLKYSKDATAEDIAAQRQLATLISETAKDCPDMIKLSRELGVTSASALNRIKVKDLAANLRDLALSLKLQTASKPIARDDGVSVIMICDRDTEANLPSRKEITTNLGRERMSIMVRRYLRDLRLGAYLDIRV